MPFPNGSLVFARVLSLVCRIIQRDHSFSASRHERCRRLAQATTDGAVSRRLLELAAEFEEQADVVERRSRCPD